MKKICYILTIIILINLAPYNAFANDDEICDEVFEKGQFIELYTSICDSAIDILNSSIDDSKKEEKLQNLFDNYKLDRRRIDSPKSFINIDSYNKEKKWVNMITRGLINTIEVKIEDSYFQYKDPINRIDKIDALLKFYKLDKEISKYELMKLDDKFSSIDIYRDISDIIENYNTKKQLALSLSNVVERIENEKKYGHIKTILEEYLMAHQLGDSIDSSELVKLIKKTKDNDKRVKLLFDEIIIKKNEKKFQEKIENIAEEIIESINYNKYYDCAERISGILKDNDIGHGWGLNNAVINVAKYVDMGYKTKQEAIQSEVFSQIKFSYSKEEIDTILDEIVSILEAESEAKMSYKEISTEHSDEIYEEFLDLVYDYRISDIKQYIIPEDIAYAYYNYEDLGYETAFESTVEHLRKILKKSKLNDNILKVIKESKYNLPVIIEGVTVVLDDEDVYKEYLNTAEINKIIDSKPKNIDAAILELILDSIIESRKEYIIYFTYEMDELNNRGNKDKEIKIANILNDKRLYSLVDEDKIMDIYIGHNDKDIPLKQELYNELFKKLISSKSNIENTIKESIIKIIDEMDSINNEDLEYIIDKTLMLSGLGPYVIENDIKNAYCFPLKYGYSDRKSGIVKIIEKGMNEKISSEIHDIFNKNLNKRDTEKEIRIVLKRNYLDSNMSFTEIKEKYKK